ncbi:MAG UNVERIFIED_CONTAM: magnesium transporter [Rickettsiaceae bacterium]|jgi:magnesium transporter
MSEANVDKYISPVYHENLQAIFDHINQLIEIESLTEAKEMLVSLHHADLATFIENTGYDTQEKILELLGEEFKADTLLSLGSAAKQRVTDIIGISKFAAFVDLLDIEESIDVINDFEEDVKNEILNLIDKDKKKQILEGFTYPDNTSGRVMEKDFITLQSHWNIGQCLDAIRQKSIASDFYAAIIVDAKNKPIGQILLSSLLQHTRNVEISEVMDKDLKIADTHTALDELSYIFKQYALTIVPVVNKIGKLVGAISISNMLYIIEEQNEAELMYLGGVYNHDMFYDFLSTAKHRFPWLFFNLITACVTALLIDLFSDTIGKFVTLAAIMPIVASMGGNAGTQAMTVTVRALHNKELHYTNSYRAVIKEILVSTFNGVALALIGGAIILAGFSDIYLSTIFAAAVVISFLVAGFFGAFIPIFLNKIKIDPAAASGVLLTAITDILGFCSFLTLAYLFLV